ncbi:MAG: DUF4173 domain-containing protein [Anaerolineales bacterium]|nr:DUF4173 domain-containing protein [Anaerolineales bacterium]
MLPAVVFNDTALTEIYALSVHAALPIWLGLLRVWPRRLAAAALLLGWATDWLLLGKLPGIGLPLFVLLLTAVLFTLGRLEGKRPSLPNLWLLAPLFFFATMVFVRANPFLTVLNVLATLLLLAYLAFFYGHGRVTELGVLGALLVPLRTAAHGSFLAAPLLAEAGAGLTRQRGQRLLPLLRGLLLALPVLLVFTALLASADLVFAHLLETAVSLAALEALLDEAWRFVFVAGAAWLLGGGLVYALVWRETAVSTPSMLEEFANAIPRRAGLGFVETATVLALVDALFAAFVAVQAAYLFGGDRHRLLAGISYADYARRGFFELVAVAVLALLLVLGLNWLARRASKRQLRLFNALSSLLVGLVLVMLVSAWQRMRLYEAAFGATELRLIVFVFIAWLAPLLLWFVATLWRRPDRFAIGLIAAVIGFAATLNALNPEARIVRQNVARYQETSDLDAAYLTTLSADAVPALAAALPLLAGDTQLVPTPACAHRYDAADDPACLATPAEILSANLAGRLEAMTADDGWRQWQSRHLARGRAFAALAGAGLPAAGGDS